MGSPERRNINQKKLSIEILIDHVKNFCPRGKLKPIDLLRILKSYIMYWTSYTIDDVLNTNAEEWVCDERMYVIHISYLLLLSNSVHASDIKIWPDSRDRWHTRPIYHPAFKYWDGDRRVRWFILFYVALLLLTYLTPCSCFAFNKFNIESILFSRSTYTAIFRLQLHAISFLLIADTHSHIS